MDDLTRHQTQKERDRLRRRLVSLSLELSDWRNSAQMLAAQGKPNGRALAHVHRLTDETAKVRRMLGALDAELGAVHAD